MRRHSPKFRSYFGALQCFYLPCNRAVRPEKRPSFSYMSVWCALASQVSAKMLTPKIPYQKVAFDKEPWSPLPWTVYETDPVSATSNHVLGVFPFFLGFHISFLSKMLISEVHGAYIYTYIAR